MKSKMTKFATAAVIIIIAVLIGINPFGGSIDGAAVAFARMTEAIKNVPWVHVINSYDNGQPEDQGNITIGEKWFSFKSQTSIWVSQDGSIDYDSGNERRNYNYDPKSETLKVQFWDPSFSVTGDGKPFSEVTPFNFMDFYMREVDNPGAKTSYTTEVYDGELFDVLTMKVEKKDYSKTITFITNLETHLPESLDIILVRDKKVYKEHFEIEYPEKGPESIYDLGVPLYAKKEFKWMPENNLIEAWDMHKAFMDDFNEATSKSIAIITEAGRHVKDEVWVKGKGSVLVEYKDIPQFSEYKYYFDMDEIPGDQPQSLDDLPESFEGILQWSRATKLFPLYNYKRTTKIWKKDSPWQPSLTRMSWPIHFPKGYKVIEDDYSIANNLICLEKIQRLNAAYLKEMRRKHPDFPKDIKPRDTYDRFLYYLDPERDYICQKYISQWGIKDNIPESVSIRDVVEYSKTDSGNLYAKKFKHTGFEGGEQTSESITKIYLEINVEVPDEVFDENKDLPVYPPDVIVPRRK